MSDAERKPFVARLLGRLRPVTPATSPEAVKASPEAVKTSPEAVKTSPEASKPSPPTVEPPQVTPPRPSRSTPAARVLLVARDRRFRAVASTLLSQRGNVVLDCRFNEDVADVAIRERIDVVLLDASPSLTAAARDAGRLASLHPPVGIVAVSEDPNTGLAALPVLPKWTAFDDVFAAVERASTDPTHHGVTSGTV